MKKIRNTIACLIALSMMLAAAGCSTNKAEEPKETITSTSVLGKEKKQDKASSVETEASGKDVEESEDKAENEKEKEAKETSVASSKETTEASSNKVDLGFTEGLIEIDNIENAFTKTSPDMLDLKGGYVSHPDYQGSDDKNGSKDRLLGETYYDSKGNIVLFCRYAEDGDLVRSECYVYDDQGRVQRIEKWSRDSYQDSYSESYEYGENGPIKVSYGKASGYISTISVFEYDEKGRLLSETNSMSESGQPNYRYDYFYEEDGSYKRTYSGWSSLDKELKNSAEQYELYDSNGNIVEKYKGTVGNEYVYYTYDDKGLLSKDEDYKGKKIKGYSEYTYDEKGRMIQKDRYSASGKLSHSIVYNIQEL